MSAALTSILTGVAAKVGAPIVKQLLERSLGTTAGGIAGNVIDAIAAKANVETEYLGEVDHGTLGAAIQAVEHEAPEMITAYVEQQRETNRLMLAEMNKEPTWAWAWRPFWMWLLAFFWVWSLVIAPVINASLGAAVSVEITTLMTLTGGYLALYMGGHTVKQFSKGRSND